MRTLRIALMLALTLAVVSPEADAQSKSFTEWGWPQPYEQVSPKSVEWLKSKGWWPLNATEMKQLQASTDKPIKIFFTHHVKDGYIEADNEEYVWGVKLGPDGIKKLQAARPDLPNLKVIAEGISPYPAVVMGFVMFSSICPHLGCHFDWNDGQHKFICPCHGSTYTQYGTHVAGPAPRGLDPLPFEEKSGAAQITWIRYKQGEPTRIVVSYT